MLAFGWPALLAVASALLLFAWTRRALLRRLGGTTGDTAGALVDERVRVRGDLAAGDAVAVAGLSHLSDGQTIRRLGPDDD